MKKTARNGTTNYPKGQGNLPKVWSPTDLETLRYSNACRPRGRPPKYARDGSPYTSAVAAMEHRLRIREGLATPSGEEIAT